MLLLLLPVLAQQRPPPLLLQHNGALAVQQLLLLGVDAGIGQEPRSSDCEYCNTRSIAIFAAICLSMLAIARQEE